MYYLKVIMYFFINVFFVLINPGTWVSAMTFFIMNSYHNRSELSTTWYIVLVPIIIFMFIGFNILIYSIGGNWQVCLGRLYTLLKEKKEYPINMVSPEMSYTIGEYKDYNKRG